MSILGELRKGENNRDTENGWNKIEFLKTFDDER